LKTILSCKTRDFRDLMRQPCLSLREVFSDTGCGEGCLTLHRFPSPYSSPKGRGDVILVGVADAIARREITPIFLACHLTLKMPIHARKYGLSSNCQCDGKFLFYSILPSVTLGSAWASAWGFWLSKLAPAASANSSSDTNA